ncbi:MAG: ATP-grasp domain-containing protein, partial [Chloroflexi bacterium]
MDPRLRRRGPAAPRPGRGRDLGDASAARHRRHRQAVRGRRRPPPDSLAAGQDARRRAPAGRAARDTRLTLTRLLVANRGEIAIRIARAAADLGIETVGVFSEDDDTCLHVRHVDAARPLRGRGPQAYLDVDQLLAIARETRCNAVHPGYGFLSEQAGFARRAAEAGCNFVGPAPATLELLGDKVAARALAERCGVPVLRGNRAKASVEEARAFLLALGEGGAVMVKAVAGGGGRGMRAVRRPDELDDAWARCSSEARTAFGNGDLYVEELLPRARHVEVQVVGDGSGAVVHLGERDCSLQRRHQKLVEVAPAPGLSDDLRARLAAAAVRMASELRYTSVGTFEFLLDTEEPGRFVFIEANPRLQVEHTVTEEVTGVDLVATQLALAAGRSLAEIGLRQEEVPVPRGFALQLRVNMETLTPDGAVRPSAGVLDRFEVPTGPGVRTDTCGYAGYHPSPSFDSLLAKVVVKTPSSDFSAVVAKAYRALGELRVDGVTTNLPFLQNLLRHPALAVYRVTTRFVDEHLPALLAAPDVAHRRVHAEASPRLAGAKVDPRDPLAVLVHGKTTVGDAPRTAIGEVAVGDGVVVRAPMQGTIVAIDVSPGDAVPAGAQLLVMEAMKMEHVVTAPVGGIVRTLGVGPGDTVYEGHPLVVLDESAVETTAAATARPVDLDHARPDLAEVQQRHERTQDAARPDAVERRRQMGQRTARENVEDLCDPGTFVEYGPLVIAAQRRRRSVEDLVARTPADGLVAGVGCVNGHLFDESRARCVVMAY